MTSFTVPDLPDWSGVTTPQQISAQLFSQPVPQAMPYAPLGMHCPAASSVIIAVTLTAPGAIDYCNMLVSWTTNGQFSGFDRIVLSNASAGAAAAIQQVICLPVKGDIVSFVFSGTVTGMQVSFTVTASSRAISGPQFVSISDYTVGGGLVVVGGSLAGGATISYYLGPFAQGMYLSFNTGSVLLSAHVKLPTLIGGAWVMGDAGQIAGVASTDEPLRVPIVNRMIRLDIVSTAAGADPYNIVAQDAAA